MDVKIAPKGTNMIGYYRKCEEDSCTRLVPCPHIRCQPHRKDMAIKDWDVEYIDPTSDVNKIT
jgi:hypothetical protein